VEEKGKRSRKVKRPLSGKEKGEEDGKMKKTKEPERKEEQEGKRKGTKEWKRRGRGGENVRDQCAEWRRVKRMGKRKR